MNKIKTMGLLGTGVIGAGWAARALHTGINVVASVIDPKMEDWINEAVENALPSLQSLTEGITLPPKGKLTFTTDPISCLLYTSPSPRDLSTSRMPSSA